MCEVADWIIMIFLVVAGVIDWKTRQIPLVLLIKMGLCVLLFRLLFVDIALKATIGGIIIGILFFVMAKVTKEAIGYGDCWIILMLGFYCGGFEIIQIVLLASLGTAIVSIVYCMRNGWERKYEIPFVPFMAAAYMGVVLL